MADEVTRPRPEGEEEVQDIQVMLSSASNACALRELKVIFRTVQNNNGEFLLSIEYFQRLRALYNLIREKHAKCKFCMQISGIKMY